TIEAQRAGFKVMAIDKGCVVNSIFHYPANMSFFTTPELLEIGDLPFSTSRQKPTREEALEYYRKVAEHYRLDIRQYQWVKTVTGQDGKFHLTATDRENRIKNGDIAAYFRSSVLEILPDYVTLETPEGPVRLKNDFVFAMTGYHPDYDFLRSMGIELSADQCRPVCDPITLESNVPGIYVAGVIVAGSRTNEIFIENGRFHGQQIAADLRQKLATGTT